MKRLHLLFLAAATAALAVAPGCGDNSKLCGPGTTDKDGLCVPTEVPPMCSDGTVLDESTNACVIDPNACQNGTVLINNKCVDPTDGLVVDLTEGPEPNNLGLAGIEPSGGYAGDIMLKAEGQTTVVKGTINPFRDADGNGETDPDMDLYFITVQKPTLLDVTIDGTNGLMAAFVALAANDAVTGPWIRYAINASGDTSKKQLFLPAAGDYAISVGDTRTMFLEAASPPVAGAGGAAGGPKANYYISITAKPIPTPTPLTPANNVATSTGNLEVGEVKFFTVPMGLGVNDVVVDIPGTPNGAVVVNKNQSYKASGEEDPSAPAAAEAFALGFKATDTSLIAVDTTYHYGPDRAPFTLTVTTGAGVPLSTTGGTATLPEITNDFSTFFYDVAADNEVDGFALTWNQAIAGVIVDENLVISALFTYNPASGFGTRTFTGYTGLLRHRTAGRYYFLTFDPVDGGAADPTDIIATSTITKLTIPTVNTGTPMNNAMVNTTFRSNGAIYDSDVTVAWQLFNATGTGTGTITNTFFNEGTAYGRLDPVTIAGGTPVNDVTAIFTMTHAETGAPQGRVLLSDGTAKYFITTRTATVTGAPTFNLDFKTRGHFDYNTVAPGMPITKAAEMIDGTITTRLYLLRTGVGNRLDFTAHPLVGTLNTQIRILNNNETVRTTFNNGAVGLDDTGTLNQPAEGWTAFSVSSVNALAAAATYDLTLQAFLPPYSQMAGTTAFADACMGGTTEPLVVDGSMAGPADDEGFATATLPAPVGFPFFGAAVTQPISVSTNGWIAFGVPAGTRAIFSNPDMPLAAAPNGVIAPFWDDLASVVICTKTVGAKLVVQWTGVKFATTQPVQLQAILDPTGKIEFVYGPNHNPTGLGSTATVGLEDATGTVAVKVGFNAANTTPTSTSRLFTPN